MQLSHEIKSEVGYFQNVRPEMLKYIPDKATRILEVGCGEGAFSRGLMRTDRELWGIEIDKHAILKAKEVFNHAIEGDFDSNYSQLPKNYFDCVIFNDVLEHMYTPWETIRQVKSLLKPEAILVSSIPNFRYIDNMITEILYRKDFQYKPNGGILDDTHIRFFTSKSILRMFQEQGYEVLVHEGIHPCKSWKEKLFITLSFGFLKDARFKQFATVAKRTN
jgi:2-polyprenyl-3-methyl-5-hydroxy-6-metoxy-1,4-benzoquinol methylase